MQRYLMHFAYVGTKYSGIQKNKSTPHIKTIQDALENAMATLLPLNDIQTRTSSRTDKGVHAFHNTLHVDLEHPVVHELYQPHLITQVVNAILERDNHDIKILKTQLVPKAFHARKNTKCRTYTYRVALVENQEENICPESFPVITLFEKDRCFPFARPLDLNKVVQAMELFKGVHDMSTFTTLSGLRYIVTPLRNIKAFYLKPYIGLDQEHTDLRMLEFVVESRSFLYHQVRRMVGTVLSAGTGELSLNKVKFMLDHPDPRNFPSNVVNVKPGGLYLTKVLYDPRDFDFNQSTAGLTSDDDDDPESDDIEEEEEDAT